MTLQSLRIRFSKARIVLAVTLLGAACLNFGASAADNSLQAVFTRMDQAAAKFKGLTADVRYTSHEAVIDEDENSTGTVVVKMPKPHDLHMLIDFKQPDPKTVQIAGTKVQIYYPKAAEVQTWDVGKARKADLEQFMRLPFGSTSKEVQQSYNVTLGGPEKVEGQNSTRIELTPKSKDLAAQFPKIELWISDDLGISIRQKLYQPGKSYSMATYTNVKLNPNIPDSAVKFPNLPKGVKQTNLQK
jgi:outer membrane lipoprotein-sorting protein